MGSSNGEARVTSEKSGDTTMVDAESGSPFALLNQPKMDIFDTLPTSSVPSTTKPRFEPKVKPRGPQARGPQAKSRLSTQSKAPALPLEPKVSGSALSRADLQQRSNSDVKLPSGGPSSAREQSDANNAQDLITAKTEPELVKVKEEPQVVVKVESDSDPSGHDIKEELDLSKFHQQPSGEGLQHVNPQGDRVVREIDVYVSRSVDPDTQLYLLQYPLRPAWRPYGLEEQCLEVRVKAAQKKLELDLAIDTHSENYDQEAAEHLRITKQTLSSSKTALTTSYAIGVLQGNKLHLNPLQAVVQLRPSMTYLDEGDAQKKKQASASNGDGDEEIADAEPNTEAGPELVALQVNVRRRETEWQEENRLQSHAYLKQLDDAEPWIPLEPHGVDSPVTDGVRAKMIASAATEISFNLGAADYIKQLVPGQGTVNPYQLLSGDGSGSAGFSRSFLNTLPLEKRFHLLLSKVSCKAYTATIESLVRRRETGMILPVFYPAKKRQVRCQKKYEVNQEGKLILGIKGRVHVLPFERLMKLAPDDCSEQEALNVLQEKAVLVQGCWVAASNLRYHKPVTIVRDYLLLLFTKNRVVQHSQLEELRIPKDILREILLSFAIQRGVTQSWEFQESTDRSFIKRHQSVVKEQAQRWAGVESHLRETVMALELTGSRGAGKTNIDLSTVREVNATKTKLHIGGLTKPFPAPEKAKGVHFNLSNDGSGSSKQSAGETSGHTSLSEATLAALPGALLKIFKKHSVCRLQFICQSLRAMAIVTADSSKDSLAVEEAKAAAQAASAPMPELEAAVSKVASTIDGVYFLTSLGDKEVDPFRNVVIALLRAKVPGSGLRKTDIMEASKIALKTDVRPPVYQKVLKELCYTKGGAWVLKPGDGRPT